MQASVRRKFIEFSTKFEGKMNCCYLDTHQKMSGAFLIPDPLVTTAIGILIDPVEESLKLPWRDTAAGGLVSQQDIRNEWNTVKNLTSHWKDKPEFWEKRAVLRLADADIDALVLSKLDQFEILLNLRYEFADLQAWPADAQLGLFSMCWAIGSAGFDKFPNFRKACLKRDWFAAVHEGILDSSHNPGLIPRNKANAMCFINAQNVQGAGLDPSILHWPESV